MEVLSLCVIFMFSFAVAEQEERLPNKCEVCKFLTVELQATLEKSGRSKEVLELGEVLDTGKRKRKIKYNTSETRLTEAVDNICEGILQYSVHAERPGSLRYAKGTSQTMNTLKNLVNKGVKVELGIPYELWDEPSVEVADMKKQFFPHSFLSPPLSQSSLRWSSPNDPCYHPDGRARHCLSDFINAAYGVPVQAEDLHQGTERNISTLTDLHNPHNLTCWKALEGSVTGNWTFTVPLGRRFEVTYISLQFCQQVEPTNPFSISILKSMDYGRSWRPLQFYSSDCMGKFGLPAQSVALSRHQETESLCSDPRPLQKHRGGVVLAFSTLDGRPSSSDFEYSPGLQDWVTATDIRIVFHQLQEKSVKQDKNDMDGVLKWPLRSFDEAAQKEKQRAENKWIKSSEIRRERKGEKLEKSSRRNRNKSSSEETGHNVTRKQTETQEGRRKEGGHKKDSPQWNPCQEDVCDWVIGNQGQSSKRKELRKRRNNAGRNKSHSKLGNKAVHHPLSPSSLMTRPTLPLALSDIQVGGRCKCNGHASRCRRDNKGLAVCQCEHHTTGPDCDVCEPFYYDRPWQRATPTQPHPCVPCQCHPLGAVGRWCNQSTGQCLCREGVTGQRCNRCAVGYKHGHSALRPCIRIPEAAPPTPVYQPQYSIAEECLSYCQPSLAKVKMNLETFCLKDYVLKIQVRSKERSGPWWQFSVWVQSVFRVGLSQVKRGLQTLWIPDHDVSCGCPTLQLGRTFLLIGAEENRRGWAPGERRLVADRSTMALQWREHWNPKLRGFRGQDNKGKCLPYTNSTTRTHSLLHTHEEHITPHLKQFEPDRLHNYPQKSIKSEDTVHTHSHNNNPNPQENTHDMQRQLHHDRDKFENQDTRGFLQETQHYPSETPAKSSLSSEPGEIHTDGLPTSTPVLSVTHRRKEQSSTAKDHARQTTNIYD
ncbi:Protein canopy 4 [Bagarius yarrelli]|uniref:Protein canopy 4 n=1 Tax=Bagarius yarrelli TaxID=175774 RepID=A0A556TZ99_BAGYA|nr:Protein canopy 4 [Bagarius yarrelli]